MLWHFKKTCSVYITIRIFLLSWWYILWVEDFSMQLGIYLERISTKWKYHNLSKWKLRLCIFSTCKNTKMLFIYKKDNVRFLILITKWVALSMSFVWHYLSNLLYSHDYSHNPEVSAKSVFTSNGPDGHSVKCCCGCIQAKETESA